MKFTDFSKYLTQLKLEELPGVNAQFKLAPKIRKKISEEEINNIKPKQAAVLVLFYPNEQNDIKILLTKRATYKGKHSAQISFPGGKVEEKDSSIYETALREAYEEVGVYSKDVKIIRKVSNCFIPPSNFLVTPVLAYTEVNPKFITNYEVDTLIEITIEDLLSDTNKTTTKMTTSYMQNIEVPCFVFKEKLVWGATAMILSEIKELLKQTFLK